LKDVGTASAFTSLRRQRFHWDWLVRCLSLRPALGIDAAFCGKTMHFMS
jgi:hypothetical protein